MAEPDSLDAFALATFHVTALSTASLALLHRFGAVGDALEGLDTAVGIVLFVVLWGIVLWATRQALAYVPLSGLSTPGDAVSLLRGGVVWGGIAGVAFFWALLVGVTLPSLLALEQSILAPAAIISSVGTLLAAAVGAAFGVAFALLDGVAVVLARRVAAVGRS